jgi:type I restriction enzyme S subunit
MNHEIFFENYNLLVDAPNSVDELRELILQLAVKGKLVPQDPNEETAAVLLEKIIVEKERLINERKLKKSQKLLEIEKNEIPFEILKTWKWARLNDVGDWGAGSTPDRKNPDYYEGSILWFKSGELNNGHINDSEEKITDSALKDCSLRLNKPGDVLIAMYGATIGKVAILEVEATTNQAVCACTCFSGIYNCYLFYLLKAYRRIFSNQGAGGAQPNISRQKIIHTIVPIPPYEEQKRIVAKVDQLMTLCDELEARQQKKHEQRIRLNNAALDKLLTAPTPEEFEQYWQRICDNFDLLYDVPETVGLLRQAILQLAVQGRLVAQDEGDEPAAVLLEEIKNEKERLIKDKKISKVKIFPPIKENEISYKLPDKWMWVRLGDALLKITDGTHHSPPNGPKGDFKYITAKNIKSKGINLSNITYVSAKVHEEIYNRCDPKPGNILYIKDGATTGIVTINDLNEQFSMLSSVALLKNPSKVYNRYLLYVLKSPYFYSLMRGDMSGVAITRVTLTKLNKALIPLAPFEEQKRIVAKVEQLMALCDELEAGLVQAQTEGGKLMEAVVHHVLAE